jgi:hypothetical protein
VRFFDLNRSGDLLCRDFNRRHSGAGDVVNKISWQKAGAITEPGRYMFTFGWLTVTESDLAIWRQFPNATFTLVEMPAEPTGEFASSEFHLGAFELPAGRSEV